MNRESKRGELITRLLEENPEWPQPADPFAQLPRPERATADKDWTLR